MEIKELRIGNYIQLKSEKDGVNDVFGVVTGITNRKDDDFPKSDGVVSFYSETNEGTKFSEFLNPISITEEWLLKFGFKEEDGNLVLDEFSTKNEEYLVQFNFEFLYDGEFVRLMDSWEGIFITEVKYVHQFQNLYFSLIGEDIEFKT